MPGGDKGLPVDSDETEEEDQMPEEERLQHLERLRKG
jgi:hypothetical protein